MVEDLLKYGTKLVLTTAGKLGIAALIMGVIGITYYAYRRRRKGKKKSKDSR
jgi:cbb3-type cytochrome oxidase subunit 3